jgi:hypothetical protein
MKYVLSVSSCDFVDNKSHQEGWCQHFGENIFQSLVRIETVRVLKHISKLNTVKMCFITQFIPLDKQVPVYSRNMPSAASSNYNCGIPSAMNQRLSQSLPVSEHIQLVI